MSVPARPDVSIILPNWNGKRLLQACLGSLRQHVSGVRYEVILADDCSTDDSVDFVRAQFPETVIHRNERNLGFARTNNAALPLASGRHLLLLNNDTVLENDAVSLLANLLDRTPNIGACGGTLINGDGSYQHAYGSFPGIRTELGTLLSLKPRGLFRRWPRLGQAPDLETANPLPVNYIVGADLMIRSDLAKKLALFDPEFVAYFEDADLCRRVHRSGFQVAYLPQARITHLVGQSYGRDGETVNEKKIALFERGFVRFCRKHYSDGKCALIVTLRKATFQKKIASLLPRLRWEKPDRRPRLELALSAYRCKLAALKTAASTHMAGTVQL